VFSAPWPLADAFDARWPVFGGVTLCYTPRRA
jgi:hypothetical protein